LTSTKSVLAEPSFPSFEAQIERWVGLAQQGDAKAQYILGILLLSSTPGSPTAVMWLRKSAYQGYTDAQVHLAGMYAQGYGVPQDYVEAMKLYKLAAEQGNAEGQYGVGLLYSNGQGVQRDDAMARLWFFRSASQGFAPAQFNIGAFYDNGRAIQQD